MERICRLHRRNHCRPWCLLLQACHSPSRMYYLPAYCLLSIPFPVSSPFVVCHHAQLVPQSTGFAAVLCHCRAFARSSSYQPSQAMAVYVASVSLLGSALTAVCTSAYSVPYHPFLTCFTALPLCLVLNRTMISSLYVRLQVRGLMSSTVLSLPPGSYPFSGLHDAISFSSQLTSRRMVLVRDPSLRFGRSVVLLPGGASGTILSSGY